MAPEGCVDCPEAEGPELVRENEDAWRLWLAGQTQWRGAGLGIIGLDYPALELVGRLLLPPVELDPTTLRKVQALERAELARLHTRMTDHD
jgi:hypothetical protein